MLHKSFKPAKCKTALKLAVSRIKLLKNKRDAQVKQLKRELAQLLESGQDRTARIRVEHVVREEKTLAAYDLIEIYCELIVARLQIIESQKNCPIDLKEAISSVLFASPRCADVPELMDVRKHFTAKYGKEFVSAAVELRPDCGVSRLLVEKLSAKAPDGPMKMKILSAIAEEHNVKWDPASSGEEEMKPPDDLLNGPNTFEQASKMNTQELSNSKGPPNFGTPSRHYEKHDAAIDSYGSNSRSSPHSQTFPSTAADPNKAMPSGTSHPDPRPFGTGSESVEFGHSYVSEQSSFSTGRQGWNMEFKDATTAAQAAAESAELASLAARAAAELSSQGRISRQHSTESIKASAFRSKNGLQNHAQSRLQDEEFGQVPVNNASRKSNSRMHLEQSSEKELDDLASLAERFYILKSSNESSQSASSNYSNSSVIDHPQLDDVQMAHRHSRKTSYELEKNDLFGEVNMKRESSESEVEFASEVDNGLKSENVGYFEEASIRKQSSNGSSHPHSHHNVFSSFSSRKFTEEAVKEPFVFDDGKIQRDSNDTNSYSYPAASFDDSGSDDDELKFDGKGEFNGQDSSSYYFPEGRKPPSYLLASTSAKSPRLSMQESLRNFSSQSPFASDSHSTNVFSESSRSDTIPSQADDLLPVTFDDSDGPSSGSEGELDESKLVANKRTSTFLNDDSSSYPEKTGNVKPHLKGSALAEKENMGSKPSAIDSEVEVHSQRTQEIEVGAQTETDRKYSYGYLHTNQTSGILEKSQSSSNHNENSVSLVNEDVQKYQSLDTLEDRKPVTYSSLESGQELNFGILTGGFRNKGYRHPPYRRNASNSSSVSKHIEEDKYTRIKQPSSSLNIDIVSGAHDQESQGQLVHQKVHKNATFGSPAPYSDASNDESDDELPQQTLASSQEPDIRNIGSEGNKKPGLRSYFDSDKSDSEEDLPKETGTSKSRLGPGFSRRTKTPLSSSEKNSSSKSRVPIKSSVTADSVVEEKSSSVSSYATETQIKPPSQTKNSYYQSSFKQGKSSEQTSSMPVSPYKRSVHEESSSKSYYPKDTRQNHPSQSNSPEYGERSGQLKLAESSKFIPESKRSSREEYPKSSAREQPSNLSPRTGGAESTKTSSSPADPPSRENSINKASHVHPKLPDYDILTAHLLSLRQNRQ
ncbi:uncharacterized protein LOC8265094 [Ricinus communis]|uniref:Regulator of Vps4 activity in the MVB pathway protein n=1 Tax=Ricinus communis TaxID=3988 RepID=B9RKC1_RICCO|nr:uncharacterized protein LOC8265094 [Ricinus communis]EEF48119.1 protein with unknown function [Ricinus communis]|eukprot:XP_002514165.1 uncharacterized protein LOC8265094 [Ricinus communis]